MLSMWIENEMKITILNERPKSWNDYYSGRHWTFRQQEAGRVHMLVKAHCPVKLMEGRVNIIMTVYFKNRPLDPDNICDKFYIDGLKGRVIRDDTAKCVKSVTTIAEVDKLNPRVEIEIEGVN